MALWISSTTVDIPEGPRTQCFSDVVPSTITSMNFGTRSLESWGLGPSGHFTSALHGFAREPGELRLALTQAEHDRWPSFVHC